MAVAILGLAVVGILSALVVGIGTSDQHHREADSNAVLTAAAESVVDSTRNPYVTCANTATYNPAKGVSIPAGWASAGLAITAIDFVSPTNGSILATTSTTTSPSPCPETPPPSGIAVHVLQKVSIRVTDPAGNTQQVTIGKSG
jgi:hypothetical protein